MHCSIDKQLKIKLLDSKPPSPTAIDNTTVIPCFKNIFHGNYCENAVNYRCIAKEYWSLMSNLNTLVIYRGVLALERIGTALNYYSI